MWRTPLTTHVILISRTAGITNVARGGGGKKDEKVARCRLTSVVYVKTTSPFLFWGSSRVRVLLVASVPEVCVLLLQDLLQSCSRGGGRRVEDMCYERRRADACLDFSAHHALGPVRNQVL
jgi:hypothetical protein